MRSFAAVLLSVFLCVQPVCAMTAHEPILYEDVQEDTGTSEETEVPEDAKASEEAEIQKDAKTAEETGIQKDASDQSNEAQEKAAENDAKETQNGMAEDEGEEAQSETAEDGTVQGGIEVSAPSAILMESSTGQVIYEKDADTQRPPASVTKVMTLLLIFDALEAGKIKLEDAVTTSEYAASMGGSQVFLEPGEVQTVDTMIKCISVASANDACAAFHNRRRHAA